MNGAGEVEKWLEAARTGSAEALGRVLEGCRRYLLLVAERETNPQLQAKCAASDIVQETFLEAQRDFGQFHGATESELLAWLRRILLNNVSNVARQYRQTAKRELSREVPLAPFEGSSVRDPALIALTPSPSGLAMERELGQLLHRMLDRLAEDHKKVISLRYLEGRSFDEIGGMMGRSPEAARKLWARAMERLRIEWEGAS